MPVSTKKYEVQGLIRMEIDMDFKTYAILLALVEKSGYRLGKNSRQKSEGIRGVMTQGILELYQKYIENDMTDEEEHQDHGLDKINQQAYIFANRARAMSKNEIPDQEIISTLRSKLPVYLNSYKKGKFLAIGALRKFVAKSTFLNVVVPKFSSGIRDLLKHRKIYKYLKAPTKEN